MMKVFETTNGLEGRSIPIPSTRETHGQNWIAKKKRYTLVLGGGEQEIDLFVLEEKDPSDSKQ